MNGVRITCDSCRRSWTLDVEESAPFEADVASRPCPYCEAYTLGCHAPLPPGPQWGARVARRAGRRSGAPPAAR